MRAGPWERAGPRKRTGVGGGAVRAGRAVGGAGCLPPVGGQAAPGASALPPRRSRRAGLGGSARLPGDRCRLPAAHSEPPHLGAGGQHDGGPQPPTMNTIVFSKLSGQVLFEEDAKERERSGRSYVGVVEGPHHAEVLLPDSPSIKESLSLRNRRTGYAVRSSPRRAPASGAALRSRPPRRRFGVAKWVSSWVFARGPGFGFSGILIPQLRWEIPAMGDAGASDWAGIYQTERSCPAVLDLPLCL